MRTDRDAPRRRGRRAGRAGGERGAPHRARLGRGHRLVAAAFPPDRVRSWRRSRSVTPAVPRRRDGATGEVVVHAVVPIRKRGRGDAPSRRLEADARLDAPSPGAGALDPRRSIVPAPCAPRSTGTEPTLIPPRRSPTMVAAPFPSVRARTLGVWSSGDPYLTEAQMAARRRASRSLALRTGRGGQALDEPTAPTTSRLLLDFLRCLKSEAPSPAPAVSRGRKKTSLGVILGGADASARSEYDGPERAQRRRSAIKGAGLSAPAWPRGAASVGARWVKR